jgi:type IV pilus assembly protein PilC
MPEFIAKYATADGTVTERAFTADSEKTLLIELQEKQYLVFGVRRKSGLVGLLPGLGRRRTVRMKEFLLFNQELAALIKAGLPIIASLDILLERRKNLLFRKALLDIRDRVRGGAALSEAFDAQGELFPKIYSSTLASGERSGELASVLLRYIGYQKTLLNTRRKILAALIYPACLFVLSFGVIFIMVTFVVPKFVDFYGDFGADLPLITRVLVGFSTFVTHNLLFLAAALVIAVAGFRAWARTQAGRTAVDQSLVRLPLVGGILHRFAITRFTRTLGTLIAGGIPAVTALGIASRAVGNVVFERKLLGVEKKVREGSGLWQGLEETGLFSDIAIEMTKVGESTGSLSDMLGNISEFYDEEIETRLSTVMSLLEPAMLVSMGLIVALMFLAIYLPLLRSYAQTTG